MIKSIQLQSGHIYGSKDLILKMINGEYEGSCDSYFGWDTIKEIATTLSSYSGIGEIRQNVNSSDKPCDNGIIETDLNEESIRYLLRQTEGFDFNLFVMWDEHMVVNVYPVGAYITDPTVKEEEIVRCNFIKRQALDQVDFVVNDLNEITPQLFSKFVEDVDYENGDSNIVKMKHVYRTFTEVFGFKGKHKNDDNVKDFLYQAREWAQNEYYLRKIQVLEDLVKKN